MSVAEMSFNSYSMPVIEDDTLPVTIFEKTPLPRYQRENIHWLLCHGATDVLEEKLTLKHNPPWRPEKKFSFGNVVLLYITTAYYLEAPP
jgi:hypothetical protein